MERTFKKQQRTVGSVVKIPLENGFHGYGRILENDIAFYDFRTTEELNPQEIIQKPILFILCVNDQAITKGYWQKIGKSIPLENHLLSQNLPPVVWVDRFKSGVYRLVHRNVNYTEKDFGELVSRQACVGYECFAVWAAENTEKRLNDYFAQRPNFYEQAKQNPDLYFETQRNNFTSLLK
ncbi:MAG: hypothetical protein EAZ97_10570 [Bacteroidetes bacterium]|nr:MAG: hypothetical protein EAZ97_10570 [Bacteroidota bacterium]